MSKFDIEYDADIAELTTFAVPARAAAVVKWSKAEELAAIVADNRLPRPLKVIGGGSNLLFTKPFDGTILVRVGVPKIEFIGNQAIVDCHTVLDDLCGIIAERGLRGTENLSGIPGTVGGALVQNAGAYGVEFGDVVESVEMFDTTTCQIVEWTRAELEYSYRASRLKHTDGRYIALRVKVSLLPPNSPARLDYGNLKTLLNGVEPTPTAVRNAVLSVRQSKLPSPSEVGSAGSFFRNPEVAAELLQPEMPRFDLGNGLYKVPAAWLIDQCGLKGANVGGASTWSQQPLVIVNTEGKATADDILQLEEKIVRTVRERYSITLIPEVEHL